MVKDAIFFENVNWSADWCDSELGDSEMLGESELGDCNKRLLERQRDIEMLGISDGSVQRHAEKRCHRQRHMATTPKAIAKPKRS